MVKSRAGLHGPRAAPGRSGFPDQFEIGAAESIRSAYTPLKPRTDEQPCHLSEEGPHNIYAATSSQTGFILSATRRLRIEFYMLSKTE